MPNKKTPKYYLVLSKKRNYTYGAFPHSPEGKKKAEQFIKQVSVEKEEELYLTER